jgi:hypothetical protein
MVVICTSGAATVGLAVTDFMLGVHICLKLHQHQMLDAVGIGQPLTGNWQPLSTVAEGL